MHLFPLFMFFKHKLCTLPFKSLGFVSSLFFFNREINASVRMHSFDQSGSKVTVCVIFCISYSMLLF